MKHARPCCALTLAAASSAGWLARVLGKQGNLGDPEVSCAGRWREVEACSAPAPPADVSTRVRQGRTRQGASHKSQQSAGRFPDLDIIDCQSPLVPSYPRLTRCCCVCTAGALFLITTDVVRAGSDLDRGDLAGHLLLARVFAPPHVGRHADGAVTAVRRCARAAVLHVGELGPDRMGGRPRCTLCPHRVPYGPRHDLCSV